MANPPVLGIAQELRAITLSPGLLSRRVTSLEVANSRTSHSRQRVGTLVSYFKLSSQVQQLSSQRMQSKSDANAQKSRAAGVVGKGGTRGMPCFGAALEAVHAFRARRALHERNAALAGS